MRLWKCKFCQKWDFQNVNFWINYGFLPQCDNEFWQFDCDEKNLGNRKESKLLSKLWFCFWRKNPGKRTESKLKSKMGFWLWGKNTGKRKRKLWLVVFSRTFFSKQHLHNEKHDQSLKKFLKMSKLSKIAKQMKRKKMTEKSKKKLHRKIRNLKSGAKILNLSKNSHLENIIFYKFTFSNSHFSRNSQFQNLIFRKIHIFQTSNSW